MNRRSVFGLLMGLWAVGCGDAESPPFFNNDGPPAGERSYARALDEDPTESTEGNSGNNSQETEGNPQSIEDSEGNPQDTAGGSGSNNPSVRTDMRPAISAETPPPPISGGTLGTTSDGAYAVVADSDRDRVVFVDLVTRRIALNITLWPGSEPGRVVPGPGQQVFVALRRGGAVVTVDPTLGLLARRTACLAPRGMAYDPKSEELHVACADGKLVTFTGANDQPTRVLSLDTDLRDVVLMDGRLFVSRLRSAELLEIGVDGRVERRLRPASVTGSVNSAPGNETSLFEPAVAWRTVQGADGSVHMLHQRDQASKVVGTSPGIITVTKTTPTGYYGAPVTSTTTTPNRCGSVVRTAVSTFTRDNRVYSELAPAALLAVDVAISSDGFFLAVANAGVPDLKAPQTHFPGNGIEVFLMSAVVRSDSSVRPADQCDLGNANVTIREPVIAVTFNPNDSDMLLAQTRSPARLGFVDLKLGRATWVQLGGGLVTDVAHDLFHRSASAGISCASCHPEGGDDGRVWNFEKVGARRTQSLDIGLQGTAPFHWDGKLEDIGVLMADTFVERMGGINQSPERLAALESWLFAIKPLPARRVVSDALAMRGQELFNSQAVGCSACHSGPSFTNNKNYDVGTSSGEPLQVPGLVGISYRSPLMHDGCAARLRDRFNPNCGGGDTHGHTSTLPPEDIDALVAYLETL